MLGKKEKKTQGKNREYMVILYFFLALFLCNILYVTFFMLFQSESFINSPYNSLQDLFSESVVRGELLSSDGKILAKTETNEDGSEKRIYPYGELFAHVIGFDSNGKSGLESVENFELLRSHQFFLDQLLNQFSNQKSLGDNVVTTLNYDVQKAAYDALGDNQGAVVVMEADTGKILAMVSKPDFDPNQIEEDWTAISGEDSTALFNRATQGQYTPGSIFKTFTLLEYYRENPNSYMNYTYDCSGGITVGEETIHCAGNQAHGNLDLMNSYAQSCNASFSNIGLSLDLNQFSALCDSLLFNQELPIDFVSDSSKFTLSDADSSFVTMSTAMGQGKTLVSPLHMVLIVSAIANQGQLMRPQLVDYTISVEDTILRKQKAISYGQLLTSEEAEFLERNMLEVVNTGTATLLGRDGYDVAGKTGTAQVSDTTDQTNSWFMGYGISPEGKRIAIAVVVEDSDAWSKNAVPITKQVLDACFK